jgi:hypothetical protein
MDMLNLRGIYLRPKLKPRADAEIKISIDSDFNGIYFFESSIREQIVL